MVTQGSTIAGYHHHHQQDNHAEHPAEHPEDIPLSNLNHQSSLQPYDQEDEEDDNTSVHSFELYTPDEEKSLLRKLDTRLVLFLALLYMLSFLDRSSILFFIVWLLKSSTDLARYRQCESGRPVDKFETQFSAVRVVANRLLHLLHLLRMDDSFVSAVFHMFTTEQSSSR